MDSDIHPHTALPQSTSLPSFLPMFFLPFVITVAIVTTVFAEPSMSIRNTFVLVPTGFICIGVFLWHVRNAALGVLRVVFGLLAIHAVLSFLTVRYSVLAIPTSGTLDGRAFSLAFVVVASGLMVASHTFRISAPLKRQLPRIDTEKIVKLAKWMTIGATAGIFYFYSKNNLLPWNIDILSMAVLRYRVSGSDEWLINRSTDVLMITVPLLFLFNRSARLFSLVGFFGLLTTFRRATLFSVIFVIVLSNAIRSGKARKLVLTIGVATGLYAASQLFYFGLLKAQIAPEDAYSSMASGLAEVRDLGWILWLNGKEMRWGTTLLQPLSPIPTFLSPSWVLKDDIRGLTTRLTGYDFGEMGGLRITLAGEGYLNFGIIGAMALSALWGWGMRKISSLVSVASESGNIIDAFLAALLVSWMAFWLHLGGSQAGGVIKSGALLLAALLYVSRAKCLRSTLTVEGAP